MKIKILFDGNFEIEHRDVHLDAGQIVEVSATDGKKLIEGLCAETAEETTPSPTFKNRKKRAEVSDGNR